MACNDCPEADYFRVHHDLQHSRVFSDPEALRMWLWCHMKARRVHGFWKGFDLAPGEFAVCRNIGAQELGVSESKWYRTLQRLVDFGCVRVDTSNKFTLISLRDWIQTQRTDWIAPGEKETQPVSSA